MSGIAFNREAAGQGFKVSPEQKVVTPLSFEQQVYQFRMDVLRLCAKEATDSSVVMAALADIVGTAAATLDLRGNDYSLTDRLHTFCARVEETYTRLRNRRG